MLNSAGIELVEAYNHPKEIGALFSEYTDMLIRGNPLFQKYLDMQNYAYELEHLEKKYGKPGGRLYLAYYKGEVAGCIGLRKIDEQKGELKRLYVKDNFRGKKIGAMLVDHIIADAKEIGYHFLLLDTLPFLKVAQDLYKTRGFMIVDRFNDSPISTSIYMRLDLK